MKLGGQVALVTGAGRGIGRTIALALAREGADLVLAARTGTEIESTAAEARSIGRRVVVSRVDVADPAGVDRLAGEALEAFGAIDILVNNAGIQSPIGPLAENDVDAWIRTIQVNLIGTMLCLRAVLPGMIARRRGKIINLSGGGATGPRPNFSAYAASKAGIVQLTAAVAEEVRPFNIQVNAIAPGLVPTRLVEEAAAAGDAGSQRAIDDAKRQAPGSVTAADRAAALAVALASGDLDRLTGRLISAVWDDWETLPDRLDAVLDTPAFTLRRIKEDGTI